MSLTELLDWLEESTGCTPEEVGMDFWVDGETQDTFLHDISDILQQKGAVLYTAEGESIKGLFIRVESWENESLAFLIQEIKDCVYLVLWGSRRLTAIPESIGQLTNLTSLSIRRAQVSKLPKSIGQLASLASLDLRQTHISKLPVSISQLKNLTSLNLSLTKIIELPESIGELTNLSSIDICFTDVSELPVSIGQLTNLTSLNLAFTQISKLPESVDQLSGLASLEISHMPINKLPESIGQLTNLTSLNLKSTLINELPESIGQLTNLTSLDISSTEISELPESIGQLVNLTSLFISYTPINELPESIAQLTNLTLLNISHTLISALPESIGQLTNLATFSISQTEISVLPESIGQLASLASLDISSTPINKLPESISQLTNLTSLFISGMPISAMPESISQLKNLAEFNIGDTLINVLPDFVGKLTNLTSLFISGTPISKLPESIGQLVNLTSLFISYTPINELPESIAQLTNLTLLNISHTQISALPESIGQLTNLASLDISYTSISELPDCLFALPLRDLVLSGLTLITLPSSILQLKLPFSFSDEYDDQVLLDGTDILEIGTSIFKRPLKDIQLFYEELEREKVLLNEARIIFIGDGGAGKSTIIYRLMTGEYKEGLKETKGILMNKWKPDCDPQTPLITFWDFGGQAVMHSMHEFFLGNRCLYVLVLDGRREDKPEYWLDLIRQYGRKSTVLIVMNKIDEPRYTSIDEINLRQVYGEFFSNLSLCELSCKTGDGFDAFRSVLIEKTKESESYRKAFPGRWYRIKEKLTNLVDEKRRPMNYLREEIYRKYCVEEGIVDPSPQEALLGWLNDLGICFSYRSTEASGAVEEFKVLRPEWITNGIYKIINSSEARQYNGFIPHDTIKEVLDRSDDVNPAYRNIERGFLLGMMREIGLSYPEGVTEFIPMLTPDSEPILPQLDNPIHIQLKYTAPLPVYVLYHLVVRLREDVDRSKTWKNGTYLTSREDCRAIIRFGKTKNIMDIFVSGEKKQAYMSYIRQNLAYVQKDLTIKFKEYIEYTECGKTALLDLEFMLTMLRRGKDTVLVLEIERDINLVTVLRSIAPDEVIQALLAKIREYEDDKNHHRQNPANNAELFNLVYSMSSITAQILTNTNENLAITRSLPKAIQELQEFSDEQIVVIQSILEALRGNEFEKGIADQIDAVLAEVRRGNTPNLGDQLNQFLNFAGSVASISTHPLIINAVKALQALF